MEARKDTLTSYKVCRFCLAQSDTLTSIYEKRGTKNTVNLPLKILSCISIEVFPSDKMPTYICNRCKFFIDISYDFKHLCRQADEHILQYIQNATPLPILSWPQSLLKIFRMANKTPEIPLVKTVVEGGATVHVTQESDSDEEDDENVYNVKIGDGSDEGSKSARVKVVTDKQEKGKPKRGKGSWPSNQCDRKHHLNQQLELPKSEKPSVQNSRQSASFLRNAMLHRHLERTHNQKSLFCCKYCPDRFNSAAKLTRHVQAHAGNRSYPCKYCNKSFVKSHHFTRHLRLKHRENIRTCRGPFGETDQYRCEQCEDSFATQDELIYHSAIHATQNLICPLCQEKFEDVDAVTAHIKSHVNGTEFMCDLCELVFTSKEKLDIHIGMAHDDELRSVPDLLQDESSMEMDPEEEEEDAINVKELDDHSMVVEIKKANNFLLTQDDSEEKNDNTNSEESESEIMLPDIAAVDPVLIPSKDSGKNTPEKTPVVILHGATITKTVVPPKFVDKTESQTTASILRKAEEIKKKVIQQPPPEPVADKKNNKMDNSNTVGASDKSLRLLEKELQELKRTNARSEAVKTPAKPLETLRSRRAQIHTSTPKPRIPVEEKKPQVVAKSPALEKKVPERRIVTKENKEPKENKETKTNNVSAKEEKEKEAKEKEKEVKEKEKEVKEKEKEVKEKEKDVKEKEKEVKEKETPKSAVKNGSEKSHEEPIRRSTRPSKIKDYAKMIRDRSQDSDDNDDSDDTDDEEYKHADKIVEPKPKARRPSIKTPAPKAMTSPVATVPRKRGRPRKDAAVAPKVRKEEVEEEEGDASESEKDKKSKTAAVAEKEQDNQNTSDTMDANQSGEQKPPSSTLVSPTGQTLKKIPIRALPPGVKAMPLPICARPAMGGGEVCEMQIGKKVVKVQKIVMTKAEVEAMTKKGLVEMKDGTMVLKQGIKLPPADSTGLRTSLVEDAGKESPSKKATPSRCDFGEDA